MIQIMPSETSITSLANKPTTFGLFLSAAGAGRSIGNKMREYTNGTNHNNTNNANGKSVCDPGWLINSSTTNGRITIVLIIAGHLNMDTILFMVELKVQNQVMIISWVFNSLVSRVLPG